MTLKYMNSVRDINILAKYGDMYQAGKRVIVSCIPMYFFDINCIP